jgi:serine/threonine-protein kinase
VSEHTDTSVLRPDPLVGSVFDKRFRVDERIAAGGFGAIYRATHVKSGHPIALKVLLPSLAQDLGVVARFRREGDTLTALRSPHTINAYELGQAGDRTLFITMELLHGESLFERYKANGPFEWKRMVKIAREVCESLEEAHAMGIVHRDLKPTNIHLERVGDDIDFVKVLDFGIAKILRGSDFDASDITNAGQMIGTIDYMSPEQMVGGKVTGQSDIYTLGIVMYEMISGCTPFGESITAAQALAAMMKTTPEPLYLRVPVPEELNRIVMRCLERETSKRYATVAELRLDLARLLAGVVPSRVVSVETRPIAKADEEATMFTPPPEPLLAEARRDWGAEPTAQLPVSEQLLAASRRAKRPSVEDTTFTPPPEPLLAESRRADWSSAEPTTAAAPSAQLLAEARRAKRPSVEPTSFTPPPAEVLAELRNPPLRESPTGEWNPTADAESERVTAIANLAEIVERAAMTRGPAADRAATVPRTRRDDDSGIDTPTPVVARKPPSAPPVNAPLPAAPPVRPLPRQAQTPVPQLVAAPFSQPLAPSLPPPPPLVQYDMTRIAAREMMIRRVIWIVALVLAAVVGVILATQL